MKRLLVLVALFCVASAFAYTVQTNGANLEFNFSNGYTTQANSASIDFDFLDTTSDPAPPAASCAYVSGDYNVPCGCNITTNIDLNGNNLRFNGTGTSYVTAAITEAAMFPSVGGCRVEVTIATGKIEVT